MRLTVSIVLVVFAVQTHAVAADRVGDGAEADVKWVPSAPATPTAVPEPDPLKPPEVQPAEPVAPATTGDLTPPAERKPLAEAKLPESKPLKPLAVRPVEPPTVVTAEKPKLPPEPKPVSVAKVPEPQPLKPVAVRPAELPATVTAEKPKLPSESKPVSVAKIPEPEPLKPVAVRPVELPAVVTAEKPRSPSEPKPVPSVKRRPLVETEIPDSGSLKPLAIRPEGPAAPVVPVAPVKSKAVPPGLTERAPSGEAAGNPLAQAEPVPEPPVTTPLGPPQPLQPLPMTSVPKPIGDAPGTVDMAGDLPGTVAARKTSPFHVVMEDFKLGGVPSPKSKKTMELVAELKKLVSLISRDLDAGGKERTRLIFNSESISKEVSALAEMWSEVRPMVSACVRSKRSSLVLEEELRNEPRRWIHVRWAFQDCQKEIKRLRQGAARLAALEPELVPVKRKGKVEYVEPAKSPEAFQQETDERRLQDLKEERDRNREREKDLRDTKDRVPLKYGT